ncbi:MAG: class I SAM-dependent methyltransferase [Rhizobiaceae bacterium]
MKNSPRIWLEHELRQYSETLSEGTVLLDAGSGDQRYKTLFPQCTYESTDFEQVDKPYGSSTYVCDLADIPVDAGRFDAIVFTQVMEHLPEPLVVLKELLRVARPGATLFYSGPLAYHEHEEPYDFYRYTQFGVRYLFESAGWEIVKLRPLDSYLSTVAYHLNYMARNLPRKRADYGRGARGLVAYVLLKPFRRMARHMSSIVAKAAVHHRHNATGYPMNYMAVARNRADVSGSLDQ